MKNLFTKKTKTTTRRDWGMVIQNWSLAMMLRVLVLLAMYLIVGLTAMIVLPNLAMWLYGVAGVAELGVEAHVALWATPLAFIVFVLVGLELKLFSIMWRAASVRIAARKAAADDLVPGQVEGTLRAPAVMVGNKKKSAGKQKQLASK